MTDCEFSEHAEALMDFLRERGLSPVEGVAVMVLAIQCLAVSREALVAVTAEILRADGHEHLQPDA